jgi:hypothetical protein
MPAIGLQSTISVSVIGCCTPLQATITETGYFPAGVEPETLVGLLGLPPEPPPEDAQLVTPPAAIANSAASSRAFRRRHASGSNTNPQTSGSSRHRDKPVERADDPDCSVEICTVTFPMAPALTGTFCEGLKRHNNSLPAGVVHCKLNVNVPCVTFSGVITSGK